MLKKIILKDGVVPCIQKLCSVPFALREALRKELQRLCKEDIIKEIKSLEWLTPVV